MTSPSQDRLYGANSSLAVKAPVRVATTANITLSGTQTIDGVAVVADDRVLVKNQTDGTENGIYIADTSTWERSPDFDGNRDIAKGTMVRVNEGTVNASGWFVVTTSDPITVGSTSISFSRETINYIISGVQTASAAQTLVNTGSAYQSGGGGLLVFVNGLKQIITQDYTETSSTSFTMTYGLQAGDEVEYLIGQAVGNLTAAAASAVAITDAGDFYVGTTVEAVFQEIAGALSEDNGDADVTYTNASSGRVQRWDTALTANRTLTLSTSNAKEGAWVMAVRGSGATGNYTLSVGSLATLRVPGEWAKCVYDAGTSAWVLVAYGILPSAEILAMSADKGDADATLTIGTSERTSRWGTALTADRTATLATTGGYAGARMTIVRTEGATGNFSLVVVVGSTRLLRLAPGQFCTVEYTGSTWIVTGFGDTRPGITHVVQLRDDFVGEEIDGYRWQSLIGTDTECRQATVLADQIGGVIRLTTGDDAAATMAVNGTQVQSRLNWKAAQGGLVWEGRVALSAITSVCVFIGLTDQVSALEMPFTLSGTTLTSNATNAVGLLFDTDATTDNWWLVGVAADVDAAQQNSGSAPVAATFETWRIELDVLGTATFYRNGTLVGTAMSGAVTPSAGLTPVIAAFSRTNASRNIDVDELLVQAQR